MTTYYVDSNANIEWPVSTVVNLGDRVYGLTETAVVFECTTAGTTNDTEPTWDTTPGNTTPDTNGSGAGDVVWTARAMIAKDDAAPTLKFLQTDLVPWAAGDEIRFANNHSEDSGGVAVTYTFANGSPENPIRLISTDFSDDSYLPGARIESINSTNHHINITTGNSVWSGFTLISADNLVLGGSPLGLHKFIDCAITIQDNISSSTVSVLGYGMEFEDCVVILQDAGTASRISWTRGGQRVTFRGGSLSAPNASAGPILLFSSQSSYARILFEDVDLSDWPSGTSLVNNSSSQPGLVAIFRRCKLPVGYVVGTLGPLANLEIESCLTSTATVPFLGVTHYENDFGVVEATTTQKRTGGASDGVNDYSWEVTPDSNVNYYAPLELPPIVYWAEEGSQTVTIHIANDVDLDTDECWMTVEHPDTATPANPEHIVFTTRPDPLVTGNAIARDSGSVWDGAGTGTDGSTGQQQLVSDAFDPTEAGPVIIRVYLAVNDPMFVDPQPTVT